MEQIQQNGWSGWKKINRNKVTVLTSRLIAGCCYLSCEKFGHNFMSGIDSYSITRVIKKMKEEMARKNNATSATTSRRTRTYLRSASILER